MTRLRQIRIVYAKEMRDHLRDRRSLLLSLVYPLLGPLLLAVVSSLQDRALDARLVAFGEIGLTGEEGYPHQGKVDFLDNQLTPSTGTIRMRALLDNAQRQFTPGLFARVRLPGSAEFKATLIDDKAVLTDQDRKYVYIVDKEGKAQRRDITPGRLADGLRIVRQGLNPGDKVIVEGLQKVFMPGMPVNAKTVAMTATSALN